MAPISGVCTNCYFFKIIPVTNAGIVTKKGMCIHTAPTATGPFVEIEDPATWSCGDGADATTFISYSASITGIPGPQGPPGPGLQTGDFCWRPTAEILTGRVRANGLTIGDASSGASERGASDTVNLFVYLWNNFTNAQCPVDGGRGASAVADYAAHKGIATPDMRFRVPVGEDDMGNSAAGRATGATFATGNSTTVASTGGEAAHVLTVGELAAHSHTYGTLTFVTEQAGAGSAVTMWEAGFTTGTSSSTGSSTAHNTMPPFMLGTWYIFL